MFHRKSEEYKELTTIFRCVGALSKGTPPATTQPALPRLELPGKAPESAILRPSVQWWRSARSLPGFVRGAGLQPRLWAAIGATGLVRGLRFLRRGSCPAARP